MTTTKLQIRPLLMWLLVSGGLVALLDALRAELSRFPDLTSLAWAPALVTTCAGVLSLCAAWFWMTLTVAVVSSALGRTRWVGAPHWLRHLVLALCGAVAIGLPAAAHATPVAGAPPGTPDTPSLEGMSVPTLPDTSTPSAPPGTSTPPAPPGTSTPSAPPGTSTPPAPESSGPDAHAPRSHRPGSGSTHPPSRQTPKQPPRSRQSEAHEPATRVPRRSAHAEPGRRVVVRPGDSLWRIADRLEPTDATGAEIERAWRRLWEDNRVVIGENPHLIRPGQQLRVDGES